MQISFYSFLFSIAISSIFIVLLYFFRKKIAFCNHYGLYTILGLYAVTFVRMALPFEFGFTNTISDHSFYPVVIDALTPDKKNFFVPEFTWLNLIFTIWIAVSVILIIRAIYKYHKAIKILKKTVIEPKPELQAQLDSVAKQCKIKSMVKLRISDSISSPVTYGFIKPVVLFSNQTFTNEEFNFIATHECCHIKNKDIWIKLLTEIYCGIFWWNPLVYLLKKDLSFCLELRCDKRVTKALDDYERCNYGQVLVTELKKCYEEENSDKQNDSVSKQKADNQKYFYYSFCDFAFHWDILCVILCFDCSGVGYYIRGLCSRSCIIGRIQR